MQVKRHCAVKYRMYPNRAQAALIDRTIGCARFIYNQMLETRIGTYKATGKSCNPTPAQYKDRYPFLREVDSLALCNAQLNVAKAYRNFFRDPKHIGFPKYKAKHRKHKTTSAKRKPYISRIRRTRRTTAITTSPSMKEAGISNYRK